MANKKLSDGVGKKIVEALKKQSELDVNSAATEEEIEFEPQESLIEDSEVFSEETAPFQVNFSEEESIPESLPVDDYLDALSEGIEEEEEIPIILKESTAEAPAQSFANYQQPNMQVSDNIKELDNFEIPSNIAVLKKLISQLPSGVTRHTGAQIIKQTMEALGISMKSVLQEAQQVQESLNGSVKECHSTVQEYKKQIVVLEKQAQGYQKQYAALNELISLFIQTGV